MSDLSLPMTQFWIGEEPSDQTVEVRKKQKAVSTWYNKYPSSNDLDIYEPEWSDRFLRWYRTSIVEHTTRISDIATNDTLKDLDWVGFFSEYPVAAVALWKVLQASYKLDEVICKVSGEATKAAREWQDMKPFEYLGSSAVETRWRKSLKILHAQFESETFEDQDEIVHRMCEMRCAVDALEDAWKELQTSWEFNLEGCRSKDLMLVRIRREITWRFSALDNAIKEDSTIEDRNDGRVKLSPKNRGRQSRTHSPPHPGQLQRQNSWQTYGRFFPSFSIDELARLTFPIAIFASENIWAIVLIALLILASILYRR